MEEWIGKYWHRLISGMAGTEYRDAAVTLEEMRDSAGILFRALGGDGGLQVSAASATAHSARRPWLQRLAHSQERVELAWRDNARLYLPASVGLFPQRSLNRDLYLWLAALAAADQGDSALPWFAHNQRLIVDLLQNHPGLRSRYRRLAAAQLALRPDPGTLPADEAAQERAIQSALAQPGSVMHCPPARRPAQPVYLWLHPTAPSVSPDGAAQDVAPGHGGEGGGAGEECQQPRRHRAERTEMPKGEGLLAIRWENIFSWAEYSKVDRGTDDDANDQAESAANDMDKLSIARDQQPVASRIRFDLDLPAAGYDDLPVGEGITLPEWDYRKQIMRPDHCRIIPMVARDCVEQALPEHLRLPARRLCRQFEVLTQTRRWVPGMTSGCDIDLDAYVLQAAERWHGGRPPAEGLYRDLRVNTRDLACLLLADLSLSTDASVNDHARVIDVIRDGLYLFAEALAVSGDRFAMHGFSSRNREHVRFHTLKSFDEDYGAWVRGRIQAIKPGYYTRMGAAVRQATRLLAAQPATKQVLLLLTDGKPNDLDIYEGRYGAEDTRRAIIEARQQGIIPFCVTIDKQAGDYLPHLFGQGSYVVIRTPTDLPQQLPILYARLTG